MKGEYIMQIIEHGSQAPIITCSCGCKFLYETSDLSLIVEDGVEKTVVSCPECGKTHIIYESPIK